MFTEYLFLTRNVYFTIINVCVSKSRLWPGVLDKISFKLVRYWFNHGQWISLDTPVSSANKTNYCTPLDGFCIQYEPRLRIKTLIFFYFSSRVTKKSTPKAFLLIILICRLLQNFTDSASYILQFSYVISMNLYW